MKIAHTFGIHVSVAVLICADGWTRFIYIPTGKMMLLMFNPVSLSQLSHEFAAEAAKGSGALLG